MPVSPNSCAWMPVSPNSINMTCGLSENTSNTESVVKLILLTAKLKPLHNCLTNHPTHTAQSPSQRCTSVGHSLTHTQNHRVISIRLIPMINRPPDQGLHEQRWGITLELINTGTRNRN